MVSEREFGKLPTGERVGIFHLENKNGAYAEVLQFGALLVKICVPDRKGALRDVLLGYDSLDGYLVNDPFFGACVGRSCNRIADAAFFIDGKKIQLTPNDNENNLHSGPEGFEKKLWEVREIRKAENSITLGRICPDGENGFPGNFDVTVTYTLTEENELKLVYNGVCDKKSAANMTNHSYFNLKGEGSGSAMDQYLTIHAESYVPVRKGSIPLGVYAPVERTPFDFREAKPMGRDIEEEHEQLKLTGGFDHHFAAEGYDGKTVREIAKAWSEDSGICLTVLTDCPGVQFYAANFVIGEHGKNGHIYEPRMGFCLETQKEPNAVNVPEFHSPVLEAGEPYHSETVFAFSIK